MINDKIIIKPGINLYICEQSKKILYQMEPANRLAYLDYSASCLVFSFPLKFQFAALIYPS